MTDAESFMIELYDDGQVSEVIRPAAIVPEEAARTILVELALDDARQGGRWIAEVQRWDLYDRPWGTPQAAGDAHLVGSLQVSYDTPIRYEITIYRATVTRVGVEQGWTVTSLCDAALGFGGLSLATCPRAALAAPPKPFRF